MKWVTRPHIRVNRTATAWLIRRFVDPGATFVFVPPDEVAAVERREGAIGFDAPNARYPHKDSRGRCSFEALAEEHRPGDEALRRLARIVRDADFADETSPVPEAAGLRALSRGFPLAAADDHDTIERTAFLYDALYAALAAARAATVPTAVAPASTAPVAPVKTAAPPPARTPSAAFRRASAGDLATCVRPSFPALDQAVNGRPLAYLDSAATTQRPEPVIEAVAGFYRRDNANPGANLHALARRADACLEQARREVAAFLGAEDPLEVVWTRGTTEGVNLVATAWGGANLRAGDEILLTVAEHQSNLLPWRLAAEKAGARLRLLDVHDDGRLRLDQLEDLLSERTRLVSLSHVSNVLGIVNPVREICRRAHAAGALVLVDGAQSAPHLPVDVRDLGCDFFAFSSHKILGPMGTGVLWGRREILDAMPPYQAGSNMAHDADQASAHYESGAKRFGAGTPNVSGPAGLAAALRFLREIGWPALREHEQGIIRHALARLGDVEGLRLLGGAPEVERISVFSFAVGGMRAIEVVRALDEEGIATRGGDLASLPLLRRFGLSEAARASCYLYTTLEEVDRLADALQALSGRRRAR
jgi:cysteine desulfurase/selenocysteine lyase